MKIEKIRDVDITKYVIKTKRNMDIQSFGMLLGPKTNSDRIYEIQMLDKEIQSGTRLFKGITFTNHFIKIHLIITKRLNLKQDEFS